MKTRKSNMAFQWAPILWCQFLISGLKPALWLPGTQFMCHPCLWDQLHPWDFSAPPWWLMHGGGSCFPWGTWLSCGLLLAASLELDTARAKVLISEVFMIFCTPWFVGVQGSVRQSAGREKGIIPQCNLNYTELWRQILIFLKTFHHHSPAWLYSSVGLGLFP